MCDLGGPERVEEGFCGFFLMTFYDGMIGVEFLSFFLFPAC